MWVTTVSRPVKVVEHAIRGTAPDGSTAKFNLGQDVPSGRWTKDLIVQKPNGNKEEYRVWKGRVVTASGKKMQLYDDQSLIAAASVTKATFFDNTLTPISLAPSAFTSDKALFTTKHGGVNLGKRALHIYDAPMRDTEYFKALVAADPNVGFLRQAARDDVRAASSDLDKSGKLDDWGKKASAWIDKIKKWIDRIQKVVSVILAIFGWLF